MGARSTGALNVPSTVKYGSMVLAVIVAVSAVPAAADPPNHAPAHGWRKKHDPYYVGYSGRQWESDFDISSGSCNRQAVATVLGGVVGGVVASRVASSDNRTVATIIGAVAGAVIGNRIGRELDEADRGCFGHALEIARSGQRVTWTNDATQVRYELAPGADRQRDGSACREFTLVTVAGKEKSTGRGLACQAQPGVWQVVQ
jgi:surface antigen